MNHVNIIVDRIKRAFSDKNGLVLIDEIVLAGPGQMKDHLLRALP